jgi:hypothetical protein
VANGRVYAAEDRTLADILITPFSERCFGTDRPALVKTTRSVVSSTDTTKLKAQKAHIIMRQAKKRKCAAEERIFLAPWIHSVPLCCVIFILLLNFNPGARDELGKIWRRVGLDRIFEMQVCVHVLIFDLSQLDLKPDN